MTFFVSAICDLKEFGKIEESWDAFVSKNSDSPYILYKFIEKSVESASGDATPLLMIGRVNDRVVGVAPLIASKKLGVRVATFASPSTCSLDFVADERYRKEFIDRVLDYLFKTLKCRALDLTFPHESDSVRVFRELCRAKQVHVSAEPYMGRRVLGVECNWEQFENLKGGRFRSRFRKMGNKLNRAGTCRVSCVEKEEDERSAFNKILEIDKRSWKENWRSKKGQKVDPSLAITWDGAGYASRTIPGFRRAAWFLELNDRPIAYAIVLQHKLTATIAKTSYDQRYRRFYPGMYLINAILRAMFSSCRVKKVDFMTDMSFMQAWTDCCRNRIRVLAGKGILPTTVVCVYQNKRIRGILNTALARLPMPVVRIFG